MPDYVLAGFKWGEAEYGTTGGAIEWSFAKSPGDFVDFDQYITNPLHQALVRDAFQVWERVAQIDFVEVSDSRASDIRLGWSAIDGPENTIGLTGRIEFPGTSSGAPKAVTEVEIMFDLAENWLFEREASPTQLNFFSIAVHEIGHAIGLDHTVSSDTMMYAIQTDLLELSDGDIAGAQALYGAYGPATAGDDYFIGTSGADQLSALAGNDRVSGYEGNDVLNGDAGDDRLEGGTGNDALNGGLGVDTAFFDGSQTSYTLTLSQNGISISDRRSDGNGTDQLNGIEAIDFGLDPLAVDFNLTQFAGTSVLSQDVFESFIELYIAYFNRAPDAVGLNFWGTAFANGTTLVEMASLFINQDETHDTYPASLNNSDFAAAVYDNVLGRVPDQGGFDFWVGALESGGVEKDQFILSVLEGAKAPPLPNAEQAFIDQQLADQAYLANKVDIGAYFAVHRGMSDVDNASAAMALFDGTSASIDQAVAAINDFYADAIDPLNGEFLMQVVGILDDPFV